MDLSNLDLAELPETIFHAPRELNTLNLTGNPLTAIPKALKFAINLEILYLDDSDIEHIGGEKCELTIILMKNV